MSLVPYVIEQTSRGEPVSYTHLDVYKRQASMCDEIIVMYGGRVCERGTADAICYSPAQEYTKGLLRSIPTKTNSKTRLVPIGGTPINMLNMPDGCAF